jgi:hypothetical protein
MSILVGLNFLLLFIDFWLRWVIDLGFEEDLQLEMLSKYDYFPEFTTPRIWTNYSAILACYNFIAKVKLTSANNL